MKQNISELLRSLRRDAFANTLLMLQLALFFGRLWWC